MQPVSSEDRYGEMIKRAMARRRQHGREGMTLRELAQEAGWSFEQVRKVVYAGLPVVSKKLNDRLCEILSLPKGDMWRRAQAEKLVAKYGQLPQALLPPPNDRLVALWSRLSDEQKDRLLRIAEAYVLEAEAGAHPVKA